MESGGTVTVTGVGKGSTTITITDSQSNSAAVDVTVIEISSSTISLISPHQNKKSLSFSSTSGQINFSFSALTNAEAYLLNLKLYDMLNDYSLPLQLSLVPESQGGIWGGGTTGTPGFTINALGICSYTIPLDTAT